ncbi:hypothetical protein L798_01103 [Zootermopsis nevadensis]|uniref:Uncharacterized protein n=1 Tax=Zootermopsis nevadensis TaxID=136037 RepID=A0A067QK13_ZOONE|nr:hypothetical protein L798_01103 [Zootermopsis nevadensis]
MSLLHYPRFGLSSLNASSKFRSNNHCLTRVRFCANQIAYVGRHGDWCGEKRSLQHLSLLSTTIRSVTTDETKHKHCQGSAVWRRQCTCDIDFAASCNHAELW